MTDCGIVQTDGLADFGECISVCERDLSQEILCTAVACVDWETKKVQSLISPVFDRPAGTGEQIRPSFREYDFLWIELQGIALEEPEEVELRS